MKYRDILAYVVVALFTLVLVSGVASAVTYYLNPITLCDAILGTSQCAGVHSDGSVQIDTPSSGNLYGAITGQVPTGSHNIGTTLAFQSSANLVKGATGAMTGTTSTQVIAAVSGNRIYVTHMHCGNSSSSVGTGVSIQDGSGGTVLATMMAPAGFGGDEANNNVPLFWTTSGNGLYAADVTTGASVTCDASGYSGS